MSHSYDLLVLGTGTAGQMPAYRCRDAGWSVAMVDPRPPGGTCANRGCDAKKPLVNFADAMDGYRRFQDRGFEGEPTRDWSALMRFKKSFTDPVPERTRDDFREAGIDLFNASPRFVGPRTVEVDGERIEANQIVIAVGLKPRPLEIAGEQWVTSSDAFLELERLPDRALFIGGGYISFEFAHAVARAGTHATILERNPRVLRHGDEDVVRRLVDASRAAGIDVRVNACVTAIEKSTDGLVACCEATGDRVEADLIVHGAGRAPSVDGLDLEAADIEHGPHGITVDANLRSVSNPAVWATGDVAATEAPQLTPVSGVDGKTVAHNLLHDEPRSVDHGPVPTVVFTTPPLASIGLTEAQARERGIDVEVSGGSSADWKIHREMNVDHAGFKVLVERDSRRIVGAHLFGPRADDMINLFALAMRQNLTADDLRGVLWAYPTITGHISYTLP